MSYKQYTSDNSVHQDYHLTCGLQWQINSC